MHFLVIQQQYNLDHMFMYPLRISRTTERHVCLCLVFTLHQQFKKLLPCVDSINDSLNLEGLISCLQGSSEGEISECLLNTVKTFFFPQDVLLETAISQCRKTGVSLNIKSC